jgi:hypothetical protein
MKIFSPAKKNFSPSSRSLRDGTIVKELMPLTCLFLMAVLFSVTLSAQQTVSITTVSPDFVKVNQAYANAKNLRMNINYSLYADYSSMEKQQNEDGVFMRQNKNTYSEMFGIISLNNSKACITLDKTEKNMVVSDPHENKVKNPGEVDIDSLLTVCSSISVEEKENGIKLYKMRFDNSLYMQYASVDILINTKTWFFQKIVLYFREETSFAADGKTKVKSAPRLEITYSAVEINPAFEPGQFSETNFIITSGKKITCAPAFASYHLINNKLQ